MSELVSLKMRASRAGAHVSGAERIVPRGAVIATAGALLDRALHHAKGEPDFINLKMETPGDILHLDALPVATEEVTRPQEGWSRVGELLRLEGFARVEEIKARFRETYTMRGAMLLDADTLERLEPDRARGVRCTGMDWRTGGDRRTGGPEGAAPFGESGKNHFSEALVLATKVAHAPGIVGEICMSDDPDYVTGYVATRRLGYRRITVLKEKGDPAGGRIFLYRGRREEVGKTIAYLEKQAVLVERRDSAAGAAIVESWDCDNVEERKWKGLEQELAALRAEHLDRHLAPGTLLRQGYGGQATYASNDYLGFAAEFGGSTGSRLTTGTTESHLRLERDLAAWKGTESALVYATGYMANVGVITALVRKGDVVLSDRLNHASIIDGCRLSGAQVVVYGHRGYEELEEKLREIMAGGAVAPRAPGAGAVTGDAAEAASTRVLVVSDGVFSMDGDMLDLPRWMDVCRRYGAFTMIDEAHANGVVGATGRGLVEHFGCGHPDIELGTLSKAFGCEGGFVCGRRLLIDYLVNRSRSFIFSTAPGAATMDAADRALARLEAHPEQVARLRENVRLFVAALASHGIEVHTDSAIVPIIVGDEARALAVSDFLRAEGFAVSAIRYPTVARGSARLRVAVSAAHDPADLVRLAALLDKSLRI